MNYNLCDKADLHCHLNGCIPIQTLFDILHNDSSFTRNHYLIEKPVRNLIEYFKPWDITRLLPTSKELFFLIIESVAKNFSKDCVRYVELRNSVIYISRLNHISYEEVLDWFVDGFECMSSKYGIDMRLIISVRRELNEISEYYKLLKIIAERQSRIIVGFDLTGNETDVFYSEWPLFFQHVKELGLGITIHAGESWNVENVKTAIHEFKADRIGHGLAIVSDLDLLELCKTKDVCVEVCLTSNVLTSSIADINQHPVIQFHKYGVPYVICSDNPGIHNRSLSGEYELFSSIINIPNFAEQMYSTQLKYAFNSYNNGKANKISFK